MMSMLSPTAEHLRLEAFEGSWVGAEEVFASAWTTLMTPPGRSSKWSGADPVSGELCNTIVQLIPGGLN